MICRIPAKGLLGITRLGQRTKSQRPRLAYSPCLSLGLAPLKDICLPWQLPTAPLGLPLARGRAPTQIAGTKATCAGKTAAFAGHLPPKPNSEDLCPRRAATGRWGIRPPHRGDSPTLGGQASEVQGFEAVHTGSIPSPL